MPWANTDLFSVALLGANFSENFTNLTLIINTVDGEIIW